MLNWIMTIDLVLLMFLFSRSVMASLVIEIKTKNSLRLSFKANEWT